MTELIPLSPFASIPGRRWTAPPLIRTGRYVTPIGNNIKEARKYLTDMELNPKKIDEVLDSFAPQTLQVEIEYHHTKE